MRQLKEWESPNPMIIKANKKSINQYLSLKKRSAKYLRREEPGDKMRGKERDRKGRKWKRERKRS